MTFYTPDLWMKIQFSFLLAPGNDETAMLKVKYLKMFNYSESITNTSLCRSNAQVLLVKTSDVSIYTWSLLHMETNGPSCRTAYLSICIGWFILSRLFSPKTPCFLSVAWTCWWAVNWLIPGVLLSAGHVFWHHLLMVHTGGPLC